MPFDAVRSHDQPQRCSAGLTIDVPAGTSAPEWVNIVPLSRSADGRLDARDGRVFLNDDPAALVAESNAELARQRGPHPVDKDHEMFSWWKPGGAAIGWATKYELRGDGIYAQVEWLPEGAGLITSKRYRYTSCNVYCEMVDVVEDRWGFIEEYKLKMKRLAGFTITNIPALEVYSMAAQEQKRMAMKEVLSLLGLPESASQEEFVRAFKELHSKQSAAGSVDLSRYVPRADYDALAEQLAATKRQLTDIEASRVQAEHDQLIKEALSAGKITPATEAEYREFLATDGGVERFKKLMAKTPEIAGKVVYREDNAQGVVSLTPAELAACRKTGMKPEEFAAAKAARQQEIEKLRSGA